MSELDIPDLSELGLSGTAAGAGALAIYWTFGPTLKAIGNAFGEWTEYRMNNLLRIGDKVAARVPDISTPGDDQRIHPRVAKTLIEEASWIEDDLHQEYVAGLFVASRGDRGEDDGGAYYARIVANLTASQVRLHYAVYRAYYATLTNGNLSHRFNGGTDALRNLAVLAPRESYWTVAEARPSSSFVSSFATAANGLEREGLITECAPPVANNKDIVTIPSLLGAIVYHRAMNYTSPGIDSIRVSREQLQRADYTFADLRPEPLQLAGAKIGSVRPA